jgi:hypothetical protein
VDLVLAAPRKWTYASDPSTEAGNTWFLDDCLFYDREAFPGHRLIGFVRIDAAKKKLGESKLCYEVVEKQQAVGYAAAVLPVLFRIGDYVLWVNQGYDNSWYPDVVRGEWKSRRIRAIDLKTGEPTDSEKVPEELLRTNKDRLWKFVESQAHNRAPELEIWAVAAISRVGDAADAVRLTVLSRSIDGNVNEAGPVRKAYDTAVKTLESRK